MSKPSHPASRDQSRNDTSAFEVQHGVAAGPNNLWAFGDHRSVRITAGVLINYRFKDGTDTKKRAVRSTIDKNNKPPGVEFVTWEDCANIKFQEVTNDDYNILITFEVEGTDDWYWSAVGKGALSFPLGDPTMKLAGLPDVYPPNEEHRGHILHEFGHALGLSHEHQSPAREGWIKLKDDAILKHYDGDMRAAKGNVIDKVTGPTNYTRIDEESIMLYQIPWSWQKISLDKPLGRRTPSNRKLSALDQAFIRLMYPPDLSQPGTIEPFFQAMITAGVDENTAGRILNEFVTREGDTVAKLTAMRDQFNIFKRNSLLLWRHNDLSRSINPAVLKQSGAHGVIKEVTQDKLFQGIVKNIVYRGVQQYGIPIKVSLPGSTPKEVMKMLGTLAMYDDVGRSISYYDSQFGEGSVVLPSSKSKDSPQSQDDTLGKETPQKPDVDPLNPDVDPTEWLKENEENFYTAYVIKPAGERTITVTLRPHHAKATFNSDEGSTDFNTQNVDVHGSLHYDNELDLSVGKKAKWTPDRIVFYHDESDNKVITSVFKPAPDPVAAKGNLGSVKADFENVQWSSTGPV